MLHPPSSVCPHQHLSQKGEEGRSLGQAGMGKDERGEQMGEKDTTGELEDGAGWSESTGDWDPKGRWLVDLHDWVRMGAGEKEIGEITSWLDEKRRPQKST